MSHVPPSRSLLKVFLLLILTCGLYYFYWVYVTSSDINKMRGGGFPPVLDLLLTLLTGGLWLYWWDWRVGQEVAELQARYGLPVQNNSALYLILDILGAGPIAGLGIVVPLIQQSTLNAVYERARGAGRAFAY
jgi:hypothetical protein